VVERIGERLNQSRARRRVASYAIVRATDFPELFEAPDELGAPGTA
jgi:hypothetical protein